VRFQYYTFAGGAHGMHAVACVVANLADGTLETLRPSMLTPEGRKKLDKRVADELGKGDAAMFEAVDLKVHDDTAMCVEGDDLVVQFQVYEVGPYALGAPSVKVKGRDAYPLFRKSDLVDALFGAR
jgi:hypothetical protein